MILTTPLWYRSRESAARMAGVHPAVVERWMETGEVEACQFMDRTVHWCRLVREANVLARDTRWRETMTLAEAARWLGLPQAVVTELVTMRVLKASRRASSSSLRLRRGAVWDFLGQVARRMSWGGDPGSGDSIGLEEAARLSACVQLSAAHLLVAVIEGHLSAHYELMWRRTDLGSLRLSRDEVMEYVQAVEARRGWMRQPVLVELLDIWPGDMPRLIEAGVLKLVRVSEGVRYFDRRAVRQLQRNPALWRRVVPE